MLTIIIFFDMIYMIMQIIQTFFAIPSTEFDAFAIFAAPILQIVVAKENHFID